MRLRIDKRVPVEVHQAIRECVAFGFHGVTPSAGVEVRVRPRRGRAQWGITGITYYYQLSDALPSSQVVVTLSIPHGGDPRVACYPYTWSYPGLKTAPVVTFGCWREELVHLAGHEAHHVRAYRRGGRNSEVAAERTGLRRLVAWRGRA